MSANRPQLAQRRNHPLSLSLCLPPQFGPYIFPFHAAYPLTSTPRLSINNFASSHTYSYDPINVSKHTAREEPFFPMYKVGYFSTY